MKGCWPLRTLSFLSATSLTHSTFGSNLIVGDRLEASVAVEAVNDDNDSVGDADPGEVGLMVTGLGIVDSSNGGPWLVIL